MQLRRPWAVKPSYQHPPLSPRPCCLLHETDQLFPLFTRRIPTIPKPVFLWDGMRILGEDSGAALEPPLRLIRRSLTERGKWPVVTRIQTCLDGVSAPHPPLLQILWTGSTFRVRSLVNRRSRGECSSAIAQPQTRRAWERERTGTLSVRVLVVHSCLLDDIIPPTLVS
ncbi:hypothetical protein LY78DRAFT_344821 [Colletotrichum sublineola]|nr:hypothetical protein LY78DRAFT_344821 [Colletotrichum sublineola]